jgi:hypothetical protein
LPIDPGVEPRSVAIVLLKNSAQRRRDCRSKISRPRCEQPQAPERGAHARVRPGTSLRRVLGVLEGNSRAIRRRDRRRGVFPVAAGYPREQALGVLIGVAMKTIANFGNHLMRTPLDAQFAAQRWEK